jgi:hypothetical protein
VPFLTPGPVLYSPAHEQLGYRGEQSR